jgi:hypothetical protein
VLAAQFSELEMAGQEEETLAAIKQRFFQKKAKKSAGCEKGKGQQDDGGGGQVDKKQKASRSTVTIQPCWRHAKYGASAYRCADIDNCKYRGKLISLCGPYCTYLAADNNKMNYLVDSGAAFSVWPHQSMEPSCGPALRGADGVSIKSWGRRSTWIGAGGRLFKLNFLLASVSFPIIRADFFKFHNLVLNFVTDTLQTVNAKWICKLVHKQAKADFSYVRPQEQTDQEWLVGSPPAVNQLPLVAVPSPVAKLSTLHECRGEINAVGGQRADKEFVE